MKTFSYFKGLIGFLVIGLCHALSSQAFIQVNDRTITLEEFNKRYEENAKYFQYQAPQKAAVAEDLVKMELGIQEAKKKGFHKDPLVIARMEAVLYQVLLERELGPLTAKINISSEEARKWYDQNPEIRTSQIFIPSGLSPSEDEAAKVKIDEIYSKYVKPAQLSFAEVAQKYSEGLSAPMGGDIDYQGKNTLDSIYYQAALQLKKPGNVSRVIKTTSGYYIIKLTSIRTWNEVDQPKIKRLVFEERRQRLFDDYMAKLRSKAKVVINKALLK